MKYGLIGKSLKHSYSKLIHNYLADYSYELVELSEEELRDFVMSKSYDGYNVTIPYKKQIMQYLDVVDGKAQAIGAVNTVVERDGRLYGYNTDFDGMVYMLKRSGIDINNKVVMILGTGGTSNTAQAVAKSLGAQKIIVVSRNGEVNYTNYQQNLDVEVVINTTPVGMYPEVDACPIDISVFPKILAVVDVIYNPENTMLIEKAKEMGIAATSGLSMLVAQAKYAMQLFKNIKEDDVVIEDIIVLLKQQSHNIVLIGMPGSGKSTIGKKVADMLERTFVDIDKEIEKREGRTIADIFSIDGEGYFREVEKRLTLEYAKNSGLVIATGGGIIKDRSNKAVLHLNGVIVEIERPLKELATDGRPLSKDFETLTRLYKERKPMYQDFRDCVVVNDTDVDNAAKGVIEQYENTCN